MPRGLATLLVALLAAIPYLNGLRGEFTFDDAAVVRENPHVMDSRSAIRPLLFGANYPLIPYRPLTMLSYRASAWVSPAAPGFHLANVLLHVLVSIAVLHLAGLWTAPGYAAFAAAGLFAVHPVHTEAVTSIVGRAELLAALLVFAGLLAAARVGSRRSGLWLAASAGCVALGLFAKESALAAIPLAALVCRRPAQRLPWPAVVRTCSVLAVACLPYFALRKAVVGSLGLPSPPDILSNPLAHAPLAQRAATALVVMSEYLAQMLFPVRLYADYSYNHVPVADSVLDPRLLTAAALLGAIAGWIVLRRHTARNLGIAAAFFFVPLVLVSNVFFSVGTIKAERLLYLPSFGFCLAAGHLLSAASRRNFGLATFALVSILGAMSARTFIRNRDWRDNFTLFSSALQAGTMSAKSYYNVGVCYGDRGGYDAAIAHFRRALDIYDGYADAAFGIGYMHELKGEDPLALRWYDRTIAINPRYPKAHLNTGSIRYRHGDHAGAESAFRAGLAIDPNGPRLLVGLALTRLARGDRDAAAAALARAEVVAGEDPKVAAMLAEAGAKMRGGGAAGDLPLPARGE